MSGLVQLTSEGNPSRAAEGFAYSKALSLLRSGAKYLCINLVHDGSKISITIRGETAYVRISGKVITWLATVNVDGILQIYGATEITEAFTPLKKTFSTRTTLDQIGSYNSPGNGIELTIVDYVSPAYIEAYLGVVGAPKLAYSYYQTPGYTYGLLIDNPSEGNRRGVAMILSDTEKPYISFTDEYIDPYSPTFYLLPTQKDFSPGSPFAGTSFYATGVRISSAKFDSRPLVYVVSETTTTDENKATTWPYSRTFVDIRDPLHPLSQVGQEYSFVLSPYIVKLESSSSIAIPLYTAFDYEGASSQEFYGAISYIGGGKYIVAVKLFKPSSISIEVATFDTNSMTLTNHSILATLPTTTNPAVNCEAIGAGAAIVYIYGEDTAYKTLDFGDSWTSLGLGEINNFFITKDELYNPLSVSPICKVATVQSDGSGAFNVLQSSNITPSTSTITWNIVSKIKNVSSVGDLTKVGALSDPEWSDQIDKWSI